MKKIPVVVVGLPGKMATLVAQSIDASEKYELVPRSITGPEIAQRKFQLESNGRSTNISLIKPKNRSKAFDRIFKKWPGLIVIDFSLPSAINSNVKFYCSKDVPFVTGTTGGNRNAIEKAVMVSNISAVVDVNMSIPVIAIKSAVEYLAKNFRGVLLGFNGKIIESHQATKVDTSGTAIALGKKLATLGVANVDEADIVALRDPQEQLLWGVPMSALGGHGHHSYSLTSSDGSVRLGITHNVDGRNTYVDGTMQALDFLVEKHRTFAGGGNNCYSMLDVMRG